VEVKPRNKDKSNNTVANRIEKYRSKTERNGDIGDILDELKSGSTVPKMLDLPP
jgi:hypothetical protein